MKALEEETRNDMERIAGAVRRERVAEAILGPTRSHAGPITRREKMEPTKEATPAWLMSFSVRLRSRRMMAMRGGMEKVEKKQEKSESHAKWKALMWGVDIESGLKMVAF